MYTSNLGFDSVCRSAFRAHRLHQAERALAAGFAFGVGAWPVLEFVRVEFAIEIGDALGEAGLDRKSVV